MPLHTLPSLPPSYRRLVSVISHACYCSSASLRILCVFGPHCLNWCKKNLFFAPFFLSLENYCYFTLKWSKVFHLSGAFQFVPMCYWNTFPLSVSFTMVLLNSWQDLQFGCLFLRFFLWLNEAKRSLVRWFSAAHEKNGLLTFFFFFHLVKW